MGTFTPNTGHTMEIAKHLKLELRIVTEKLGWLGTTGSGKTYGASKLAEEFWSVNAQFIVLDPVGVWYGLRLSKDGKKPSSIDIPIFGGLHGDIPLESTSGSMIADLIVDKNLSIILDVSQFESDAAKARFASDFASRFFFRKKAAPSAVHLFLEECQEFVPQNPQRGEEKMLHEFIRMQKLGRNFGIGSSYITQRPQEVNKKALNMAQTLFVFRTTGTHERTAIEKWIEDKSLDESIAQDLPKLETGTCHVWSPEFLKVSKTVKILEKNTFNASATPEVGKSAKVVRMADIDIPEIQEAMQATIEKAKNDDPRLLRAEIARMKKSGTSDPDALKKVSDKAFDLGVESMKHELLTITSEANNTIRTLSKALLSIKEITKKHEEVPIFKVPNKQESRLFSLPPARPTKFIEVKPTPDFREVLDKKFEEDKPKFSKGARAIYSYLHGAYPLSRTKAQLWVATGYSPGGGFNNYIYELTGAGLIIAQGDTYIMAKDEPEIVEDIDISLEKWLPKLSKGARSIFQFLLNSQYDSHSKSYLAQQTRYAEGGGFNNYIYELTGKELVIKTQQDTYMVNPAMLEL